MEKKNVCLLCQEETNHKTQNCPSLTCKKCGQKGHAQRHCPIKDNKRSLTATEESQQDSLDLKVPKLVSQDLDSNQEDVKPQVSHDHELKDVKPDIDQLEVPDCKSVISKIDPAVEDSKEFAFESQILSELEKPSIEQLTGLIKAFDRKNGKGMILQDDTKKEWNFESHDQHFKISQIVTFDLVNNKLITNVNLKPMTKKAKKENSKKKKKSAKNPTSSLCLFDIQVLKTYNSPEQIIQIGFIMMHAGIVHSVFRPIWPIRKVPSEVMTALNLETHNKKLIYKSSETTSAVYTEEEALQSFVTNCKEVAESGAKIGLFVFDADKVISSKNFLNTICLHFKSQLLSALNGLLPLKAHNS